MAEKNSFTIKDNKTFKSLQKLNIASGSVDNPKDEFYIISIAISTEEDKIALLLGKKLIRDENEITEIAVYKNEGKDGECNFELEKLRDWDFKFQASDHF